MYSTWVLFEYIPNYRYGDEVERYLEVFLATPNADAEKVSKALMARGGARRAAANKLLTRAHQGIQIKPCNHDHMVIGSRRLPSSSKTKPHEPRCVG